MFRTLQKTEYYTGGVAIKSVFLRALDYGNFVTLACHEYYSQGQYWAGRAPPPYKAPPYMAAANFVVITNGEGCALNGTADIDQ